MSLEVRSFETKRGGGLLRGGSRGAYDRIAKLSQRNASAYANGQVGHAAFNARFNRLNRAAHFLQRRKTGRSQHPAYVSGMRGVRPESQRGFTRTGKYRTAIIR